MNDTELKFLAGRLRLATQAREPWHFFLFLQGADGKPYMEVHRKAVDELSARKRARKAAKRKDPYYGTVGVASGDLVFNGKTRLAEQQIRTAIKENLANERAISAMSARLKGATFVIESLNPPPPVLVRSPEIDASDDPPEDPLQPLRDAALSRLDQARVLRGTDWETALRTQAETGEEGVLRVLVERIDRSEAFVEFLSESFQAVNLDLEGKVREFNARVAQSKRVQISQLWLFDLATALETARSVLRGPPGLLMPRSFPPNVLLKGLEHEGYLRNEVLLRPMPDALAERTHRKEDLLDILVRVCSSEWTKVKKRLLDTPATADSALMWQMVLLRKHLVDQELLKQKRLVDGHLVVKSVGSQNLTSDYDLTLSTDDGSGREIQAIRNFNDAIKASLGKQPGVVFDTNLYAKDFLKVDDTVFEDGLTDGAGVDEVVRFLETDRSDQDVAALTKMRQYMDPDEWQDYFDRLCDEDGLSEAKIKEIALQLDETDALFLMKNRELWDRFMDTYEQQVADQARDRDPQVERARRGIAALSRAADGAPKSDEGAALTKLQEALVEEIDRLGHHLEDLTLEVRNNIYLDRMEEVRSIQTEARLLAAQIESADAVDTEANERLDALRERAKKLIGEANFFAAEAYLSEGPLQHIVFGSQSGNPEVFATLKPEHFLESINEQTGDFFKDLRHYSRDEGEAFYQTSKYLHRMMDGVVKLATRDGFAAIEDDLPTLQGWGGAEAVGRRLKTLLLPIRGAKGEWSAASAEDKSRAAVTRAQTVFSYASSDATIANLKADVLSISVELNRAVRAELTMRPDTEQARRTFRNLPDV